MSQFVVGNFWIFIALLMLLFGHKHEHLRKFTPYGAPIDALAYYVIMLIMFFMGCNLVS